jgi:hypothetical protein
MDGGVKPWDTIQTYFGPDGSIAARLTMYDNGVIKEESFENGVRSQTAQYDNPQLGDAAGAKAWDSIIAYYDAQGNMAARLTTYDNGVIYEENFENGIRTFSRQLDNPGDAFGEGVKSWESIDSYYGADGELAARLTKYDNGVVREQEYEGGVRTYMRQMDNPGDGSGNGAKVWDTIETYYDEAGQISARLTNYDDGRVRQDYFENGVRSYTEIQDGAYGEGEGQYAWTAINISYDETGKIAQKSTIFDDGRVREESFENGVRTETTIEDRFLFNGGNYSWDQQHFVYAEDGSVASREISYDNGDARLTTYEDGLLSQRSDFDGDGSHDWLGRTITYNDDGSVLSVQTYDTASELPEDFFVNLSSPEFETLA